MTGTNAPPGGWRLWWLAARPKTLTLAVAPVLVGTALAWRQAGVFDPVPMLGALAGAALIQAGTNLHNDVADALRGGDQPARTGPARITARGWASAGRVRAAAVLCFALAGLVGLYLAAVGGWPILGLGVASLLSGWAYSGEPRPIAYTPLGEIFVIAFFGVGAVAGSAWLQVPTLTPAHGLLGLVLGLPAAGVLMANNHRDREADRAAGRRTLAILAGPRASRWIYAGTALLPFLLLLAPPAPAGAWMGLAALPLAWANVRAFFRLPPGPAFNAILAATARAQLALAGAAALGMAVW